MQTTKGSSGTRVGANVRVATWNLQSCRRGLDGIVAHLRALDADVVALQEVDRHTLRSGQLDQAAHLASRAGYAHHHFFAATDWDVGEYGVALLSRHPLSDARAMPLPITPGIEPRVVGTAVAALPHGPLSVYVTHLSHRRDEASLRVKQVARIHEAMACDSRPKVLVGDFNDLPGSRAHRAVTGSLTDVFDAAGEGAPGTFPLPAPLPGALRIDYVFACDALRPLAARVARTAASDHHALVAHVGYPRAA